MTIFSGQDILHTYPRSKFTLDVPSLTLPVGSITGVVGENGNGKTTLLKVVSGQLRSEGSFSYFGQRVGFTSNWLELKSSIAFIPQRIPRWYGTLEQNLYLKAALEGIEASSVDDELNTLLDFLDLQRFRKLKWTEISTGYRLRFELARVLLGDPSLLVLDEPLANLDINTQQKFLSDLKVLLNKRGKDLAVILSSQQLHEIESVAGQMVFLKEGKSTFEGSLDEIGATSKELLYELQLEAEVDLQQIFPSATITKEGPYYHVRTELPAKRFMTQLMEHDVHLRYYRDLSRSTKRFFHN